jgi:NADH dehydrogenase FAD-containing subunit
VDKRVDVVVIGGGYAGVMAADRLTREDRVAVTLVNPRPVFVERIRLHQRAAGTGEAVVDFRDVLAPGVRLVVGSAERIDAPGRRVVLEDGTELHYDHLVYAVGSSTRAPDVPGAAEFALAISSLDQADRLREALRHAPEARVVVVGGGSSGIETAAELAEAGRAVRLITGGVLAPSLHPRTRRAIARRLQKMGVAVWDGADARVTEVTAAGVRLRDGRTVAGEVVVWAVGFAAPRLAARSGLSTDAAGRLRTDETLTSIDDERIVAAGDAMVASDTPRRMSCQLAGPLGANAAEAVLAHVHGEAPAPVTPGFVAQCVSLGRRDGVFQYAHADDTASALRATGWAGARIKETICRGTVTTLVREARRPGSTRWSTADRTRRQRIGRTSTDAIATVR